MPRIPTARHIERTQLPILDQFYRDSDHTFLQLDDIYSATARVFDLGGTPIYQEVLVLDDVFFDTPQLGPEWTEDGVGYNFAWTAPSVAFPKGGRTVRIVIEVLVSSENPAEAEAPIARQYLVQVEGRP